jgi:hypothetical protein
MQNFKNKLLMLLKFSYHTITSMMALSDYKMKNSNASAVS